MAPQGDVVRLRMEERAELLRRVSTGQGAAYRLTHARIVLTADAAGEGCSGAGWTDAASRAALDVGAVTGSRRRTACGAQGLEAALPRKKRETPPVAQRRDGAKAARRMPLACSAAPEGRSRWTMERLAAQMVVLGIAEQGRERTGCRTVKKRTAAASAAVLGHAPTAERGWGGGQGRGAGSECQAP